MRGIDAPDGGWGWIVVACATTTSFLIGAVHLSFSILFGDLLLQLGTSSVAVAWIYHLNMGFWSMFALLTGPLVQKFGHRLIAFIGAFLISLGITLSAFATSEAYLSITYGIIAGIGNGLHMTSSQLIISSYFFKNKSVALGVWSSGLSLSRMVAPICIATLTRYFSCREIILMVAALSLQMCIFSMSFRPVPAVKEKQSYILDLELQELHKPNKPGQKRVDVSYVKMKDKSHNIFSFIFKAIEFKMLKLPMYIIFMISDNILKVVFMNYLMMHPLYIELELDGSKEDAAVAYLTAAAFDFVGRIAVTILGDWSVIENKNIIMIGYSLIGTGCIGISFATHWWIIMVLSAVFGVGNGAALTLNYIAPLQYFGPQRVASAVGIAALNLVWVNLSFGLIIGYICDTNGSYRPSFLLIGALILALAMLWIMEPLAKQHLQEQDDRRKIKQFKKGIRST